MVLFGRRARAVLELAPWVMGCRAARFKAQRRSFWHRLVERGVEDFSRHSLDVMRLRAKRRVVKCPPFVFGAGSPCRVFAHFGVSAAQRSVN